MSRVRLLLVDDVPDNRYVLRHVLKRWRSDLELVEAASAAQALALLREQEFDGALIDVQMPGMSGIELCRRIKSAPETSRLSVLLISSHESNSELRARGLAVGADDFIKRPIDNVEFLARIGVMLRIRFAEKQIREHAANLDELVKEKTRDIRLRQRVTEILLTAVDDGAYQEVLDIAREVLRSDLGIFGYIDGSGDLVCPTLTREVWDECTVESKSTVFRRKDWAGIWGRALTERIPISANDGLVVPEGHLPLTNALAAPILHQGRCIGLLMVANRAESYTESDLETLASINSLLAPVLAARLERDAEAARRDQAETKLRRSEERFRLIAETVRDVFWVGSRKGDRIDYVSPIYEEIWGRPCATLIENPHSLFEAILEQDQEAVLRCREEGARRGAKVIRFPEYRIRRPDGSIRWIQARTYPVESDFDGSPREVGIAADITDLKEAEDKFRESTLREEEAVRAANVGLWDWWIGTDKVHFSAEWKKQLGYENHEIADSIEEWKSRIHPDDLDMVLEDNLKCIEQVGQEQQMEYRLRHRDGSYRTILSQRSVILDASGDPTHLRGSHIDVTVLRQAEKERALLEEQLHHVQRLEAVGRLAGGIAHDFNNLLTVVTGYAEMLEAKLEAPALRSKAEQIGLAAHRGAGLTRQLLAYSRRQVLQPVVLDLNKVLTDVEQLLVRLVGEQVSIVVAPEPDLRAVWADRGQVEQIVMNLVANARDAMPTGGSVTVSTTNVDLDDEFVARNVGATAGPNARLSVTDTGCGMSEETMEKIFEPFFTTKERGQGTGLGLSTVYGIVKQSGGSIFIESDPGRGTKFDIYFPALGDDFEESPDPIPRDNESSGNETILLVEDDNAVREFTSEILSEAGYSLITARSGNEGLEEAKRHSTDIDLLVTDLQMPEMSGTKLAEEFSAVCPGAEVLIVTGHSEKTAADGVRPGGGERLLLKPFSSKELLGMVHSILRSRDDSSSR